MRDSLLDNALDAIPRIAEEFSTELVVSRDELVSRASALAPDLVEFVRSLGGGYSYRTVAYVAVVLALREVAREPVPLRRVFSLVPGDIVRQVKRVLRLYSLSSGLRLSRDPIEYIKFFAPRLGLSSEEVSRAIEVCERARSLGAGSGKDPRTLALACILIATDYRITPTAMSRLTRPYGGVSYVVISRTAREIEYELARTTTPPPGQD